MSSPLNIIFAGTPDFAAQHLAALLNSKHNIIAVYCPPDKPAGRGKKLTPCATKQLALDNNLVVEQPVNFKNEEDQQKLASYNADVMVVVAYGLLLPKVILDAPRLGCINVHGSILPKWRGAAPIQRAVESGNPETGVTIMQMDEGLDTGDMLLVETCEINQTDTSADIYHKLADIGPIALVKTLEQMANGQHKAVAQEDNALATYAHKLDKAEAELDWTMPAKLLQQKIRAYIPWPVAQFTFNESAEKQHRIRIWQASVVEGEGNPGSILSADKSGITIATGEGALRIENMQLPGKKALPTGDILNSRGEWFKAGSHINGQVNK